MYSTGAGNNRKHLLILSAFLMLISSHSAFAKTEFIYIDLSNDVNQGFIDAVATVITNYGEAQDNKRFNGHSCIFDADG